MTAAKHGGRFLLRQPPLGHGARGRKGTRRRTKQKAAMDRRGLGAIRDVGRTLLLALKDGFEVLELLAVGPDLVAEHRVPIRIGQI